MHTPPAASKKFVPSLADSAVESSLCRGGVDESQLHALDAVPAVQAQAAGSMHGSAAPLGKRASEPLAGSSEGNGI
jgi:hypothetical protein